MMFWIVLVPISADLDLLRKEAGAQAKSPWGWYWAPRGDEIAFGFRDGNAAFCFTVYCTNQGIQFRLEWPKIQS
jgi:hypothetical protein